jgi:ABC-2 type transport system ATP-binding protein
MDANRLELANTWADDDVIVDRLTVHYRDTAALDGVSFSVPRGRVLAVVGANGAGKSTLFRALLGLVPVSAGTVRLFGKNASELEPFDRGRLAYVSERHVELEHQRVSEVAAFRAAGAGDGASAESTGIVTETSTPAAVTTVASWGR